MKTDRTLPSFCYKRYSSEALIPFDKRSHSLFLQSGLRQSQRGMTLIIGLILLVMLTVIGLIGFRNTTMSERMTGNAVDRNASFQSSESSGKEALQVIETTTLATGGLAVTASPPSGYYPVAFTKGGATEFWTQGDDSANTNCTTSTTSFSWTNCSAAVAAKYAAGDGSNTIKNKAQYAIEFLSATGTSAPYVYNFRVTSRSTGGSGDAEVVLQTIYTRSGP